MHPLAKAQGFQLATSGHDKHKGISQVQVTKMGICQSTSAEPPQGLLICTTSIKVKSRERICFHCVVSGTDSLLTQPWHFLAVSELLNPLFGNLLQGHNLGEVIPPASSVMHQ